jgi:hypothetical protein
VSLFEDYKPSIESYWRSIILFGRNVASYKFALGNVLLELADKERVSITLEELALPFAQHISNHLQISEKQGTSSSSKFLDACRKFNEKKIGEDELRNITARIGFVNVIDAFHNVNQGEIPIRFYVDERQNNNRIVITDELLKLKESIQFNNLPHEIEARWRLVETAWSLNINRSLLSVEYNEEESLFYTQADKIRRINITSARDALNGYQKGKCFYCFADISIESGNENLADVDHFFAHSLRLLDKTIYSDDLNGVWNLVLACAKCNRGESGKFAAVPTIKYLERLHTRNSFLINSHHPLRETLINYTGRSEDERRAFLQAKYNFAKEYLVQDWETRDELEAQF